MIVIIKFQLLQRLLGRQLVQHLTSWDALNSSYVIIYNSKVRIFTSNTSSTSKCTSNVSSMSFSGSSGALQVWLQPKPHRAPVKYLQALSTLHKQRKQCHLQIRKLNSYEYKWIWLSHAKQYTAVLRSKSNCSMFILCQNVLFF